MGFVNSNSFAQIKVFVGFSVDNAPVNLQLRTLFLYRIFTSLFRYIFPKKPKLGLDSNPYEKYLTMAGNSAKEASEKGIRREKLRRVFSIFDKNDDGMINKEEMKEYLDKLILCVGEYELASMVWTMDVNGDGYIDFDEFLTLYESMSGKWDTDLVKVFNVFYNNGDGLITIEELTSVFKSLGLRWMSNDWEVQEDDRLSWSIWQWDGQLYGVEGYDEHRVFEEW